jgi:hypothetical protein
MRVTEPGFARRAITHTLSAMLLTFLATGGAMAQAPVFSPVIELRQYTLHPARRDGFIDLFDRNFVESQEALGMKVIGQFRDLDEPSRFVWLRGFSDMAARTQALTAFYDGALWKSLRDSANASIIDNDNVLLLRPAHAGAGFTFSKENRPAPGTPGSGKGLVIGMIYHIDAPKEAEFIEFFDVKVSPLLAHAGGSVLGEFVCERGANTFPRLPVREGEHVFVWFSAFQNAAAYERFKADLRQSPAWRDTVEVELTSRIREPQVLRLAPSARSLLHGR